MKKKNRISFSDDDRKVAIYARKSRITHKGDSIGVQFKQSGDGIHHKACFGRLG